MLEIWRISKNKHKPCNDAVQFRVKHSVVKYKHKQFLLSAYNGFSMSIN